MFKNVKITAKVFAVTSIIALVNIGLLVYQFSHLVISAWNIIPTVIVVLVVGGNLYNMLHPKVRSGKLLPSQFGAKPTSEQEQNAFRENEDFYAINTSFPTKLTGKNLIVKALFLAIFVGLTVLFGSFYNNVKYDTVVQGTIIEKHIEGEVYTDVSADGVSQSDNRYMVYVVSYEVGGNINRTEVIDRFSTSRQGNFIKLCVNNDGEYVCVYDKLISYKVMMYTCIVSAVLTLLGFVFKLPNQYLVMLVIGAVGIGIICLFNSADWANWLLKDFTLFGGCFVSLCVMSIIQLILLRIIFTIGRRKDPNFIIS